MDRSKSNRIWAERQREREKDFNWNWFGIYIYDTKYKRSLAQSNLMRVYYIVLITTNYISMRSYN